MYFTSLGVDYVFCIYSLSVHYDIRSFIYLFTFFYSFMYLLFSSSYLHIPLFLPMSLHFWVNE